MKKVFNFCFKCCGSTVNKVTVDKNHLTFLCTRCKEEQLAEFFGHAEEIYEKIYQKN